MSTPWQGLARLPVGLELQQRVIDAVEEHLVVDVLALHQELFQELLLLTTLRRWRCVPPLFGLFGLLLLLLFLFPLLLPALLQSQVEVKLQH